MPTLTETMAEIKRCRHEWQERMWRVRRPSPGAGTTGDGALTEEHGFGSDPGHLRMLSHVPRRLAADPPLVVVLHGCNQTAADYSTGAGWITLADRYGFCLLLPEQRSSNNPARCFDWFSPAQTRRDRGQVLSIRQMIEAMVVRHGIDRERIYITGLSAGGAMTSAMLACYPEVFAGGAIVAGLPYGAAGTVQQAFDSMRRCPSRSPQAWGDLVRAAAPRNPRWPRISVWHGTADTTVIPANAREILKQWTNVHGLPEAPSAAATVDGYDRKVWKDAAGDEVIEFYGIADMAHGAPLSTGKADDECGTAGPYLLDIGISSSYHITKFFGLATRTVRRAAQPAAAQETAATSASPGASPSRAVVEHVYDGEILEEDASGGRSDTFAEGASRERSGRDGEGREGGARARATPFGRFVPVDVDAVISSALRAAGLMRGR
ncbi:alpha/beta hydrolase family esterase [Rhodoplanes sp. SY1]|uniref:extracellular catalytic domain type 1 short-chain-length polyhydroxyalkanoate depolymerase n=1 Tax=Rhodoplanes sp. SY1 TaxID=3166646 RepID=UPI0038B5F5FE